MKHPHLWTEKDREELAECEQDVRDAKERRRKLFARIRQRAWRKAHDKTSKGEGQ